MGKSQIETEMEIECDEQKLAYKLLFITINDFLDGKNADNNNDKTAFNWLFNNNNDAEFTFVEASTILFIDRSQLRFMLNIYKDRNKLWIKETEYDKLLVLCRKKYSYK